MPCRVPGTMHPGWKESDTTEVGEVGEREIALSLRWKDETLVAMDEVERELLVGAVNTEEDVEETVEAALMDDDVGPEGEAAS